MSQKFLFTLVFWMPLLAGCTLMFTHKPTAPLASHTHQWALVSREACLGDMIRFEFYAGNTRAGRLLASDDPKLLAITETSDAGIYNIREIAWIECNAKIVYP
jgi:hypothetical protein